MCVLDIGLSLLILYADELPPQLVPRDKRFKQRDEVKRGAVPVPEDIIN